MTDLEITKLCAEAMGFAPYVADGKVELRRCDGVGKFSARYSYFIYDPLHDDAQAMNLIKKFQPIIEPDPKASGYFGVTLIIRGLPSVCVRHAENLNRAICECVAKMELAKKKKETA